MRKTILTGAMGAPAMTVSIAAVKARPDDAGVFEYACREGNHGMRCTLAASRLADR